MAKMRIVCWGEAEKLFAGRDSLLRREECEVLLAASAREVVRLARRADPSLVLIDQEVAGRQCLRLCRALKSGRRTAAIPLVLIATDIVDDQSGALARLGVDALVQQPGAHRLSQMMARLLGLNTREHPRYAVDAGARVRLDSEEAALSARAVDLSLAGSQLEIEHPLALGSEVSLSISLPGLGDALQVRARVVRIMVDPFWGRNRLGLHFVALEPGMRERLESFLLHLAEAELRPAARPEEPPRQYFF